MTKRMKYLSLLLVIVLLAGLLPVTVGSETAERTIISENFNGAERPDSLTYNDGSGSISVQDIGTSRALYLQNDSDGSYTLITKTFAAVTDGILTVESRFLQPDQKSDNNIVLEILHESNPVFSVVTESGNLSVKRPDGSYQTLVTDYYANKWYAISIVVDFDTRTCDFSINGTSVREDIPFLSTAMGADTISSYARYSPGFYLDDLNVTSQSEYQELVLSGISRATVPTEGETAHRFTANLLSESGQELTGETLSWSISGETTGVRLEPAQDTMSATLFVSSTAIPGSNITVRVASAGGTLSASNAVALETLSVNQIKIFGDARVSAYQGKRTTFAYSASVYDQLGNEIPGQSFIWELDYSGVADITLDATGVLTVSGKMPEKDEKAVIIARLSDGSSYATKNVLVQRYDTYYNDKQRFEAAITGVDNIIKAASNPDGRNPLMGFYISPYTGTYGYWNLEGPKNPTACSNLSEQFQLMRAMDGITGLTGNESYAQRVRDIYRWQLDHGISANGLVCWGNHQTLDLETGEWAEYYKEYATTQPYVEVKDRDLYMEPFFEIDPEAAAKIVKDHWCAIINDWSTMSFNRHAVVSHTNAPNYSGWNNTDAFLDKPNGDDPNYPDDPWVRSKDLCFASSSAALMALADYAYKETGDKDFLTWATRLIYRYINTRNEETGMFGTLFTSSQRLPGIYSLEETFGKTWWATAEGRAAGASNQYGDRAFNQFSPALIELGLISKEDAEWEILEGEFLFNNYTVCSAIFMDVMHLAETMMNDADPQIVADGEQLAKDYFSGVAAYVRYGYDFNQNIFHKLFTNGIIMDDVVWTRPGYWGSAGKTIGSEKPSDFHADNFIQGYLMTAGLDGMDEDRQLVWEAARNICDKSYHMGDIGNPALGEKPDLNLAINSTDPMVIRILLHLYEASGWEEYLTQARVVGNNIVSSLFKEGYFIENSNLQYINTDGEYPYVLLKLEATLRGEPELVPESRYQSHYECDAVWRNERGELMYWDSTPLKSKTYPNVNVTSIRLSTEALELKVGEKSKIDVRIVPDDATSKAIFWDIKDKDVVGVTGDNTFVAKKEGETVAYAVSRSTLGMASKPIRIKVSR